MARTKPITQLQVQERAGLPESLALSLGAVAYDPYRKSGMMSDKECRNLVQLARVSLSISAEI